MAEVQSNASHPRPRTPPLRRQNIPILSPNRMPEPFLPPQFSYKSGHLNLDTFSPVDQNGSFCFDRVIKSGKIYRRLKKKGAWKPSWKPAYLVLRPNLLSIYKDADETHLNASITLSDVTAVAPVRKSHMDHVFGVFSPAKNYHFQSPTEKESSDWIALIRAEARTDDQDDLNLVASQSLKTSDKARDYESTDGSADESTELPGSPVLPHQSFRAKSKAQARNKNDNTNDHNVNRQTSALQDYSGNELLTTSHSDFSDIQVGSLPKNISSSLPKPHTLTPIASNPDIRLSNPARSASQLSIPLANPTETSTNTNINPNTDPERVIRQGWISVLKGKGGVKQWKSLWAVLRSRSLTFYKNEQEYSAIKILPMNSVINAAEIDPISRNKKFCLQIIIEDKTYRLSVADEDQLANWLGALKSVLSKRYDNKEKSKAGPVITTSTNTNNNTNTTNNPAPSSSTPMKGSNVMELRPK